MGTDSVLPSGRKRSAVSGRSLASSFRAPEAWRTLRISIQWPKSIMMMRIVFRLVRAHLEPPYELIWPADVTLNNIAVSQYRNLDRCSDWASRQVLAYPTLC